MKKYLITLFFSLLCFSTTAFAEGGWSYARYSGGVSWMVAINQINYFAIYKTKKQPIDFDIYHSEPDSGEDPALQFKRMDIVVDGQYRFNNVQKLPAKKRTAVVRQMHFAKQSITVIGDGRSYPLPIKNVSILPMNLK